MNADIDRDLLEEDEIEDMPCSFCLYLEKRLTGDELRAMWGLEDKEPRKVNCTTCNRIIEF